jgi:hypothetical protein
MTDSRDTQRERQAEAAADPESEVIQDLDVTGDDADRIAAGGGKLPYLPVSMGNIVIS